MIDTSSVYNTGLEKRRFLHLKRRKLIWLTAIGTVVILIIFTIIYSSTDLIFGPPEGLNSNSAVGDWAMFRHDLSHTGNTDPSGTLPQGTLEWTFATGGVIHSSPAVAGGVVYVGSRDNKLYALDAATGTKLWEFKTGSWVESSPAIVNGVVYFGSNDGKLYAVDAATGSKIWEFNADYPITSSPAIADGTVYFGADNYDIYAVDASTGEELWHCETGLYVKSSPTVFNGIVYIGSMDGFLYSLNANSGRLRLKFSSGDGIASSPVVYDETIYFGSTGGSLYAIEPRARNWPFENNLKFYWEALYFYGMAPRPPIRSGLLWSIGWPRQRISASPTIVNDILYTSVGSRLVSVDIRSQQEYWAFETGSVISSSTAIQDTVIYVANEEGRLYALDTISGEKLWDILIGGRITSSPAIYNGTIYIGSHNGNLYAIK